MSAQLGEYLNAINTTKEGMLDENEHYTKQAYPAFVVTRCMSYFPDTLFASNEMNTRPHIDPKLHFDFLRFAVRPRKRFSKWIKREQDDRVGALIAYYGFSAKKAREALGVLSEEAIAEIQKLIFIGGKLGKSK